MNKSSLLKLFTILCYGLAFNLFLLETLNKYHPNWFNDNYITIDLIFGSLFVVLGTIFLIAYDLQDTK